MIENTHDVFRWLTIEEYTAIYNQAYRGQGNHTNKDLIFRNLISRAIIQKRRAAKLPLVHPAVYSRAEEAAKRERQQNFDAYRKVTKPSHNVTANVTAKETAKISQPHREARRKCGNPEVKSRKLNACRPAVRRKAEKRVVGTAKSTTAGRVTDYKGERRPCRRKQR